MLSFSRDNISSSKIQISEQIFLVLLVVVLSHDFHFVSASRLSSPSSSSSLSQGIINKNRREQAVAEGIGTRIFDYSSVNPVADQAAIDLDKREIDYELDQAIQMQMDTRFENAMDVYSYGAHSKSFARITLTDQTTIATLAGSSVRGTTNNGQDVKGTLKNDLPARSGVVEVLYPTTETFDGRHVNCQVGASSEPVFDGCFSVNGYLDIGENNPIEYTYSLNSDNLNDRSIRRFSVDAGPKYFSCLDEETNSASNAQNSQEYNRCPYDDFMKYSTYYGKPDYADEWVTSALRGSNTNYNRDLDNSMGDQDFSLLSDVGRAKAVESGILYLNIWMEIVGSMETAISRCFSICGNDDYVDDTCHNQAEYIVAPWDDAVAYYVGSIQNTSARIGENGMGSHGGNMLFQKANDRCMNFHTCGGDNRRSIGNAHVNIRMFEHFNNGQHDLLQGRCERAIDVKNQAVSQMTVPLIQGLLRIAYMLDMDTYRQSTEEEAEGATLAAALLPLVHACSPADADIIYQHMKVQDRRNANSGASLFADVKDALENNYSCLGVRCHEVGGLIDITRNYIDENGGSDGMTYLRHAQPCDDRQQRPADAPHREHIEPPPPPPSPPRPHTSGGSSSTNSQRHHNHRYHLGGEFSVPIQFGICIGLFVAMCCITLFCNCCWRVPTPASPMEMEGGVDVQGVVS